MKQKARNNTLQFAAYIASFLFFSVVCLGQGKLENKGRIENQGTGVIRIKGSLDSPINATSTTNGISNAGKIVVDGPAVILQDTVGGRVDYVADDVASPQNVPQLKYKDIRFFGKSVKKLDSTLRIPLVAQDTLVTGTSANLKLFTNFPIIANGRVQHNGVINTAELTGKVDMTGSTAQSIDGTGVFKLLDLNNTSGADVINRGGFQIVNTLFLTRGEMRNSTANNFVMSNGSNIVRTDQGSLQSEPQFAGTVNVRFTGTNQITSGGEIPSDSTVLRTMRVQNAGGLVLAKSAYVNDTLSLNSSIQTESTNGTFVLSHTTTASPEFINPDAEIIGSMRRTRLNIGDFTTLTNVFNNRLTAIRFSKDADLNGIKEITLRVLPGQMPNQNTETKVRRSFFMTATDFLGNPINNGFLARVQYAWRIIPDDETNGLDKSKLAWQHWDGSKWTNSGRSATPNDDANWAYGISDSVSRTGIFAIGLGDYRSIVRVNMLVYLEGPYLTGSMENDLKRLNFIPTTPPNMYPYNLDPNRAFVRASVVPDSVVDWVVIESRELLSAGERRYKTCFVRKDGVLVDLDGVTPVALESGEFYIIVHHRNHLAVMTKDKIQVTEALTGVIDFTNSSTLLGGTQAAKYVESNQAGRRIYAMFAGDTNGDGIIDERDTDGSATAPWKNRFLDGYVNSDTDLNGTTTTRDFNVSWNNYNKTRAQTSVPR